MPSTAGRIDEVAFTAVVAILFGLSIITATIRTTYRIKTQGRLLLDDFLLLFACVTLTAATGLIYVTVPIMYWEQEMIVHPQVNVINMFGSETELFAQILRYRQLVYAYLVLTWTTIFSVKICFLLFFHQLIDRVEKLLLIWKIVFVITMLVFIFCACGTFIACPYFRLADALRCVSGTPLVTNIAIGVAQTTLDILTDLLIIMIPVVILWNVKIKRSHKLVLGLFLCLSICMIIIAILRMVGLLLAGKKSIDVLWQVFFQQVEASISVITVSLTAFRALLGMKALHSREKKAHAWYSVRRIALLRKGAKRSEPEFEGGQLPSIPSATLTGIRTFIRGHRYSKNNASADLMTSSTNGTMQVEEHHVKGIQKTSSESDAMSKEGSTAADSFV